MISFQDIKSSDWSMQLDQVTPGDGLGNVVQGIADVEQCLGIILSTPQGTDPLRPLFAVDFSSFIDQPMNVVIPALVGAMADAITAWEPRIKLLAINATPVLDGTQGGAQMQITVRWQLALTNVGEIQTTIITIPWST